MLVSSSWIISPDTSGTTVIVNVWQKPRQANAVPKLNIYKPLMLYGTANPTEGMLTE